MEPATPDWRAFGQPATAAPSEPVRPEGRAEATAAWARRLPRTTLLAFAAATVLAVGGIALALGTPSGGDITLPGDDSDGSVSVVAGTGGPGVDGPAAPVADLVVDVAGGVSRPGLVRLAGGSRVGDAIAAAGGYAASADLAAAAAALNLAAPLQDGEKVLVPELGTTAVDVAAGAGDPPAVGEPTVDLNAATASELDTLPGIGPVTAERILEARAQAPFTTVDELRSRGLVGESVFGRLRDLVSVGR